MVRPRPISIGGGTPAPATPGAGRPRPAVKRGGTPAPATPGAGSPRVVFFDIGNVLLHFDSQAIIRKLGWSLGHHPLKIARFLLKDGFIDAVERGQLPARRLHALFRSELDYGGSFQEFARLWCGHFTLDRGAASLLKSLSQRIPVYLLSNTNDLHYRHILRRYDFPRRARGAVLSYKLGLRKPQPEIYLAALRKARCAAQEAVFIDDLKENVAAAAKLGFHAIRYTGSAALRRELAALGLLRYKTLAISRPPILE